MTPMKTGGHDMKEEKIFVKKTQSFCDVCKKKIPAEIYEENGTIYISKSCDEHGTRSYIHRIDDPEQFHFLEKLNIEGRFPAGT